MDTRKRQKLPVEAVVVDLKKVEKIFKSCYRNEPTQEERDIASQKGKSVIEMKFEKFMTVTELEEEKAKEKGITAWQWKLRELYREIFDQEFILFREAQELRGNFVSISGLTLQERMDRYPTIAELALKNWAEKLGLLHLYKIGINPDEAVGKLFTNSSGQTVYERFFELLCTLF